MPLNNTAVSQVMLLLLELLLLLYLVCRIGLNIFVM
jgi:hypothetical protein